MYTVLIKYKRFAGTIDSSRSLKKVKASKIVKVNDLTQLNDSFKMITDVKVLEFPKNSQPKASLGPVSDDICYKTGKSCECSGLCREA